MNAGACAMNDLANCLMPGDPPPYWEYGQREGTFGSYEVSQTGPIP